MKYKYESKVKREGIKMLEAYIGKRVIVVGDHPWSGEIGEGKEVRRPTFGKPGLIVALDNGTDCFVFSEKNLKVV